MSEDVILMLLHGASIRRLLAPKLGGALLSGFDIDGIVRALWHVGCFTMDWPVLKEVKKTSRADTLRDKSLVTAKTTEEHEVENYQRGGRMFTFEAFSDNVIVRTSREPWLKLHKRDLTQIVPDPFVDSCITTRNSDTIT